MKTYSNIFYSLLLTFLICCSVIQTASSQPLRRHQARAYLNRTVLIIHEAKNQLNTGKNYTGEFARAVAHQKMARNLFQSGQFQKAIFHSHRARILAFAAIKSNNGIIKKDFDSTKEEESLQMNTPKEEDLDRDLKKSEPNISFDDRAAARAEVKEIDDK